MRRSPPRASRSASSIVGCAPVPPSARVESAPHAFAIASARPSGMPASQAARNPASNESPAPVVSTASAATPATRCVSRRQPPAIAPRSPSLTTTMPRVARRGAGSPRRASAMCAMRVASIAFGQEHVGHVQQVEHARRPTARTDPSSGRPTSSRRAPVHVVEQRRQHRRERRLQEVGADVHVAGALEQRRVDAARRASAAIVPGTVRIARSSGRRARRSPRSGRLGVHRRGRRCRRRRDELSRTNRPNTSSPTTAQIATRRPSSRGAAREDRPGAADRQPAPRRPGARPGRTPARRRRRAARGRGWRRPVRADRGPPSPMHLTTKRLPLRCGHARDRAHDRRHRRAAGRRDRQRREHARSWAAAASTARSTARGGPAILAACQELRATTLARRACRPARRSRPPRATSRPDG